MVFMRPFYGLVMFTWLAYMRAPDLCWGFARDIRFSFIVAIVMFLGFFIHGRKKFYVSELRNHLLLLLTVLVVLSVIVNFIMDGMAYGKYEEFAKIVLIAIFTVAIVDEKWKIRVMVWTIALSLGFYGFKGGIFGFMGGDILRGPGGLLQDNNDFSLAMVMNLPFLFYLAMEEKDKRVKWFLRITALLTVATVVATQSRGGFLALVMAYLFITARSRYKLLGLGGALVAGVIFLIFIPPEYVERLKTISDLKEASAASRIIAWKTAFVMIKANPFFGVGLGNFYYNYLAYCPIREQLAATGGLTPHVAHNSFLQIWAEAGTVAFIVLGLVIVTTLWKLRKLKKQVRLRHGLGWVSNYANMFEVSLFAYLVGAVFLNRGQFDLMYQIVGLSVALGFLAVTAYDTEKAEGPPVLSVRSDDGYLPSRDQA